MAEIDEALTRRVAELAKLELSAEETRSFTAQLGTILGYIEQLKAVKVEGVEPMNHPLEMETPLREDAANPFPVDANGQPKVLKHAPDVINGGFKVPPII